MILTGENWSTGRETLYSVGGKWVNEYGSLVEWYWQGKPKYSEKDLPQCHFHHHNSHMDWPGVVLWPLLWQAADWQPQPRHDLKSSRSLAGTLSCTSWSRITSPYLPETVVVEGVVTGIGQVDTEPCTHRIKNLDSGIHPHLQNKSLQLSTKWRIPLEESCELNSWSIAMLHRRLSPWLCTILTAVSALLILFYHNILFYFMTALFAKP
jgi:hypothetical protein